MPGFGVTIELSEGEPKKKLQLVMRRAVELSTMELKGNTQRNSPFKDGKMQSSWLISAALEGFLQSKLVSSAMYTPFVNDGTGIYGPKGKKIYPKTARLLGPFKWNGRMIAVPWIRGQKGQHFVEKSITQTERRSDEFVIRAAMEVSDK